METVKNLWGAAKKISRGAPNGNVTPLGVVFVLISRFRRVVPDELVTLTLWDARDFLIFLVMVGWKGKDAAKDGVVAFSCLLNCLRVSLLGFSSFCSTLSMMRLTLSGGVHFVRRLCRLCPVLFVSVVGA